MNSEEWAGWIAIAAFVMFVLVVFLTGVLLGKVLA